MEAAGLGTFMVAASLMTVVLEHPSSIAHGWIPDPFARRLLMGLAMGLTAMALVYSPWGRRSGAHLNPSVTLTFYRLGRVTGPDALGYVGAQFVGGILGTGLAATLLAPWIAGPPVNYAATVPGPNGLAAAFAGELVISFALMTVVLTVSNAPRFAAFTGVAAGLLIATFITFEAPFSGMSMNPARTFGPSVVGGIADSLWLYFVAPPLGMLTAGALVVRVRGSLAIRCAKLHHGRGPCIFCNTATAPIAPAGAAATASTAVTRA